MTAWSASGRVDTFYKNNKGKADLILQVLDE
jgi:hypothetical protein